MASKLLLYLPFDSNFYQGLYIQMKRGFEENGCQVEGGCGYLSGQQLLDKIEDFQPDFIFEMNRTKSEIDDIQLPVPHVCWLVDYWGRSARDIRGSEILYLFSQVWCDEYRQYDGQLVDHLYPGTDTDIYSPDRYVKTSRTLIFLGHMPDRWSEKELNRPIYLSQKRVIQFRDVLPLVHQFSMQPKCFDDGVIQTRAFLRESLSTLYLDTYGNQPLSYDIYARAFREGRRVGVLNQVIADYDDIHIYGGKSWLNRPSFARYYKGFLDTPEAMNKAFNQGGFLLHDGNMPHFRIFDAMAAGCIVLRPDVTGYGINDEWRLLDLKEKIEAWTYRLDDGTISEMCQNLKSLSRSQLTDMQQFVREKIVALHSWAHRAEKIIGDVQAL